MKAKHLNSKIMNCPMSMLSFSLKLASDSVDRPIPAWPPINELFRQIRVVWTTEKRIWATLYFAGRGLNPS